jgi:cyanophycinase-like exopeptidase
MTHPSDLRPGRIVLFGSGETSPSGSKIYQSLAPHLARPLRVAVLETPAGFELNSAQVAGRVADFLASRLQNDKPQVSVVPARKRGTPFSPDEASVIAPLGAASLIFMGAGSPTYTVRQLQASLAWHTLQAAHRQGAAIVLASATVLAASAFTLPVYEIYKVGEEVHWHTGLDFLAPFGLPLVFIPHWNNAEGGADLDTSRCFMGQSRFAELLKLLPPELPVVGIDEHTALTLDLGAERCEVLGTGGVVVLRGQVETRFPSRASFALSELGPYHPLTANTDLPAPVWEDVRRARQTAEPAIPDDVSALVEQREAARRAKDWPRADAARAQLAALGWQIKDSPSGPIVERAAVRRTESL